MKILLDNGHGENTAGKRSPLWPDGSQLFEWAYTREITSRIFSELTKLGIDSELIVRESIDVPIRERARRVNSICKKVGIRNCFLISIHCNAFNGKAVAGKFTLILVSPNPMNMLLFSGIRLTIS